MATRFVTTHKSNNAAINDLADRCEKNTAAVTSNATTTAVTMTAAQFMSGLYINAANGALALTLPTAADLIAAIPNAQVGSKAVLFIRNDGDNTVTITTNTGLTLSGTATIATTLGQILVAEVTSASAVKIWIVLKVAN